jgi:hypothetical protein
MLKVNGVPDQKVSVLLIHSPKTNEVVGVVPGEGSSESCAFVSSRTRSAAASSSMNPIASQSFLAPSRPLFIARSTLRPSSPDHPQAPLLILCPLSKRL